MSTEKIVLLGLGMQGKAVLDDLVKNTDVDQIVVADNSPDLKAYLRRYSSERVFGSSIDATNEVELSALIRDADVVIESLPGTFALPVGRLAAKLGVNLVSSMYYINPGEQNPENIGRMQAEVKEIDRQAKAKGCTILTEFGMDPGIDLVMGAKALSDVEEVHEFYSYGAGFPAAEASNNPLKYKFTWSIIGLLRSYLRPAKIISQGKVIEIPAQEVFVPENRHILELEEIGGPLESYPNGNSAHYAELFGIKNSVKEMARYTCRWPGHCAFWEIMAKSGFLNPEPITVGNVPVAPIEFVAALLNSQPQFHLAEHEQDLTLLRIDVRGIAQGKRTRIVYQLIDRRDLETGFTSMQRTVGFTMSLGAQLILQGKLPHAGLLSPIDVPYSLVAQGLKKHNMSITRQELSWND
ncbi:saccharopine dehydrogenase [Candidatus Vecturithrix granuli]|uniref:Saccharopine dehydrogenase n=1 Tax=Vecturithrix granuli TaxID=1499967 RepID=A0A0S6WBA0_VECG1|nr:saccharopine dehydrogenase [Candidatus Vecturithrix granuli]